MPLPYVDRGQTAKEIYLEATETRFIIKYCLLFLSFTSIFPYSEKGQIAFEQPLSLRLGAS